MVSSTLNELIAILKEAFFQLWKIYEIGHFKVIEIKVACLPVAAVSVRNQHHFFCLAITSWGIHGVWEVEPFSYFTV